MSKNKKHIGFPPGLIGFGKLLEFCSNHWAVMYAARLFVRPMRYAIPSREQPMLQATKQYEILVPRIKKKICIYESEKRHKKALLVHGWSGRGTQFYALADHLVNNEIQIITFDAPAHGLSPGKLTMMSEFIEIIHFLDKQYDGFDYTVGHSLGALSLFNALSQGMKTNKHIAIASGNSIVHICEHFVKILGLKPELGQPLKQYLDKKFGEDIENFAAYRAAKSIDIPVLVIHDQADKEILLDEAKEIVESLRNGELHITQGLGHRRLLRDQEVVQKILTFIKEE